MVTFCPSSVVAASSRAVGASFTPPTLTVTVTADDESDPSRARYWKESSPVKSASGV